VTASPPLRSPVEPPPRHAARSRFGAWLRGPGGRFAVPALAIVAVLVVTGTAGTYLPQSVAPRALPSSASPTPSPTDSDVPDPVVTVPTTAAPTVGAQPSTQIVAAAPARPQEALAGWAQRVAAVTAIPDTALRAYGYATLRLAADKPGCHLAWTTLAAIGKVESNHGRADGATLQPDGSALPPILGAALNGQNGLKSIPDTDHGRYDGDQVWDHAVGPMQFIPNTWAQYQADADNDGADDPNDINDAALAAANYLCAGGRDLATSGGWWGAVLSYNAIQQYAQSVFDAADDYGRRARSIA
jgi:membrane-bound lytic murein transglycosylase B